AKRSPEGRWRTGPAQTRSSWETWPIRRSWGLDCGVGALRQPSEGYADILSSSGFHHARNGPMRQNPPLVQHDDVVVVRDLLDEMGGPQHRGTVLDDQSTHVAEDIRC